MLALSTITRLALPIAATACLIAGAVPATAQSVEEFYRGRTVDMIIGYPPGGSNDVYARVFAQHVGKHIPGNPTVVSRNMPGGGSMLAANFIYNVAPKDGSVIGLVAATIPLSGALGASNVQYEPEKFTWIGRIASFINMTMTWNASPVKTIQDAYEREVSIGAGGVTSTTAVYPSVLQKVLGVKFKMVIGYAGSAEAMLAMERGEVEGHTTGWDTLKSTHPDWITDKKINVIVQHALVRHPELPDVPTSVELARTPEEKELLRIVANATEIGKSILAPPDLPADRTEALRRAFDATVVDPAFVAGLTAAKLEITPLRGEELQKLVEEVTSVPPETMDKVRAIYPME